jgi:uncharacterized pyridoxamine 5'-phosphate oxidase family protein
LAEIKSCDLLQTIHFEGTQELEEIYERDAKPIMDVCVFSYTEQWSSTRFGGRFGGRIDPSGIRELQRD